MKTLEAKNHFETQILDLNAQLQRQIGTFGKHIDDLEIALTYATDKINKVM